MLYAKHSDSDEHAREGRRNLEELRDHHATINEVVIERFENEEESAFFTSAY